MPDGNKNTYQMMSNSQIESLTFDISEKIAKLQELQTIILKVWERIEHESNQSQQQRIEVMKDTITTYRAAADITSIMNQIKEIKNINDLSFKNYEEKVNKISIAALTGLKEISEKLGNMKINVDVEKLEKELEKTLSAFSVRKMIEIDSQMNNKVEEFSKPFEINAEILKNFNAEILKNNQKLEEANKLKEKTEHNLNEIYNNLNFKLKLITPIIGIAIFISGLGLGYGACHFQNQKIISNFLNEK